jgi:hypothetical protein
MKPFSKTLVASMLALAFAFAGAPALAGPTADAVEKAQTPADHEAIAKTYDEEAKALRAKANDHRQMARRYSRPASFKGSRVGGAMEGHCKKLASNYDETAESAEALAADHREMAKEAGK